MPRFDQTGPQGMGPMTGRGLGPCGSGLGRGAGRGFGWRKFMGYCPFVSPTKKEEKEMLKEETELLEQELKAVKSRLTELK